jgi:hypothetical protein
VREGYWINYHKSPPLIVEVDEHEQFLRRPGNADKLGISDSMVHELFTKFEPVKDRDKMLTRLMHQAPLMRVRGHGTDITFEFASHSRRDPLEAISDFARKNAGPYTWLNIVNLATGESNSLTYEDYKKLMDEDNVEAVLRAASIDRWYVARKLLRMAKKLLS